MSTFSTKRVHITTISVLMINFFMLCKVDHLGLVLMKKMCCLGLLTLCWVEQLNQTNTHLILDTRHCWQIVYSSFSSSLNVLKDWHSKGFRIKPQSTYEVLVMKCSYFSCFDFGFFDICKALFLTKYLGSFYLFLITIILVSLKCSEGKCVRLVKFEQVMIFVGHLICASG